MPAQEHDDDSGGTGIGQTGGWQVQGGISGFPPVHAPIPQTSRPTDRTAENIQPPTNGPSQGQPRARWRFWGGNGGADLKAHPFPLLTPEEWRRPREGLRRMYLDAERRTIEAYDWYMRDRLRKRAASRALRVAAIVLGAAGGLQPLISLAGSGTGLGWGYVFLAAAGVCVGIDHFLGLSSRWMRDMLTARKIHQRLQRFQLDWAALDAMEAIEAGTASGGEGVGDGRVARLQEYLDLLRGFSEDIAAILIEETSEWVNEYRSGLTLLQQTPPGQN